MRSDMKDVWVNVTSLKTRRLRRTAAAKEEA